MPYVIAPGSPRATFSVKRRTRMHIQAMSQNETGKQLRDTAFSAAAGERMRWAVVALVAVRLLVVFFLAFGNGFAYSEAFPGRGVSEADLVYSTVCEEHPTE